MHSPSNPKFVTVVRFQAGERYCDATAYHGSTYIGTESAANCSDALEAVKIRALKQGWAWDEASVELRYDRPAKPRKVGPDRFN
jgi:hypothetical protein